MYYIVHNVLCNRMDPCDRKGRFLPARGPYTTPCWLGADQLFTNEFCWTRRDDVILMTWEEKQYLRRRRERLFPPAPTVSPAPSWSSASTTASRSSSSAPPAHPAHPVPPASSASTTVSGLSSSACWSSGSAVAARAVGRGRGAAVRRSSPPRVPQQVAGRGKRRVERGCVGGSHQTQPGDKGRVDGGRVDGYRQPQQVAGRGKRRVERGCVGGSHQTQRGDKFPWVIVQEDLVADTRVEAKQLAEQRASLVEQTCPMIRPLLDIVGAFLGPIPVHPPFGLDEDGNPSWYQQALSMPPGTYGPPGMEEEIISKMVRDFHKFRAKFQPP